VAAEPPTPEELERAILHEEPSYSTQQLAVLAGATLDQTRRLWRALGFPEHGEEVAYTQADVEALGTVVQTVKDGDVDFDTALDLTRAVGQSMARLAEWQVATAASRVEEVEAGDEATGSRMTSAMRLVAEVKEPFERLLVYSWRRHLAASVARVEALGAKAEALHARRVTVGFADIVSFTALSNGLEHGRIGDLVEVFESRCADVVAGRRGRVIKSLGDSVLFVNADPLRAVETAEGIIAVIGRDPRLPDVRVGLATGSVVTRMGDVFGPPVNLAARLTGVARRNHLIVDAATAQALPADQFESRRLPARPLHGFGVLEPVTLRRT
jgi:adenylate cyclase